MKIYAITKGCHSDYHICALTISQEKAEQLKIIYSDKSEKAEIEEFVDYEGENLNVMWLCFYGKDGGSVTAITRDCLGKEIVVTYDDGSVLGAYVFAKDAEHAEKKTHDMIAEYKARKEGIC